MSKIAVARFASTIGHPFAFILLLILLPLWVRGQLSALRVAIIVGVAGLLPLGLFMRHRHASGKWATVDASDRADRPVAYLATFAVVLPMSLYFRFVERSPALFRGCAVIALMLAIGAVLNRWIKLSGHMTFAGFSAVVLARVVPGFSVMVILFIPVLAWSRIALGRHTVPEVTIGLLLGMLAGGICMWG